MLSAWPYGVMSCSANELQATRGSIQPYQAALFPCTSDAKLELTTCHASSPS